MQTVEQLIENARACGEDFTHGREATSGSLNSARMRSIVPAMEAVESGAVTLASNTSLARDITLAYAAGANISYSAESEATQVSKTQAFLLASESKVGLATMEAVRRIIADTNDDDMKKVLQSRTLEKMATLLRVAIGDRKTGTAPHVPERDAIMAIFAPVTKEKNKHEILAGAFKKMAKLAALIADTDPELYGKAFLMEKNRYTELQVTHEARAKVIEAYADSEKAEAEKAAADKAAADKAAADKAAAENAKETTVSEDIGDLVDQQLELA